MTKDRDGEETTWCFIRNKDEGRGRCYDVGGKGQGRKGRVGIKGK